MKTESRRRALAVAAAAVAASAAATALARAVETGLVTAHGGRSIALGAVLLMCSAGVLLYWRGARRRARLEALRSFLPRYKDGARPWMLSANDSGAIDPFLFDDPEAMEDYSSRMPVAREEIRAATRALLVSLEDEMRREGGRDRRAGRPACRRARLRAAGRPGPGRRRIAARPAGSSTSWS